MRRLGLSCGILSLFIGLSLMAALYSGVVLTLMTDYSFYLAEFQKTGIYSNFEDKSLPPLLARQLTNYFRDDSDMPPNISKFDISESYHLRDVKLIVLSLRRIFYMSSFLLLCGIAPLLFYFRGYIRRNLPMLLIYFGLSIIGIGLLLILLALNFSWSFTIFHEIFFPNGNWQFPRESTLIMLLPEQFFQDAFIAILLRTGFFGILLLFLGLALRKLRKYQKEL